MIPENEPIFRGAVVRRDGGHLLYMVEDTRPNTDDYKKTHKVGANVVNYTQLQNGDYPAGSPWNASETVFREEFTLVNMEPGFLAGAIIGAESAAGGEEATATEVVTKDEFGQHWGAGYGLSWGNMRRFALRNPDFPLRPSKEDETSLTGNINAAISWMNTFYGEKPKHSPCFRTILERIVESRASETE